uniref:Phospholipase B1, membrane-associated n=1 Tax=Plectus sambesii TaxID=2011161 RepID=A0A914VGF5_9BILA
MLRNGLLLCALLCVVGGTAHHKRVAERYMNDAKFRERLVKHIAEFPSAPITNGAPDFNCPNMVSQSVPTNVHSLRPGDIKVVAALGDSLTAGNGAGATNLLEVLLEYRGEAFSIGGDDDLSTRHFNPALFGQSYKIGATSVWDISYLNTGFPGDIAADLPGQAHDLVTRMQSHPDDVDMQNDWKLITLFIGANDICNYCVATDYFSAANYVRHIKEAVQFIYDNVPRVLLQIVSPLHVEIARQIDAAHPICDAAHILFECQCEFEHNVTDAQFSAVATAYEQPDGTPNLSLFAPDCFHFSGPLHSAVARILWNTMITPLGQKQKQFNLTNIDLPLNCPDPACPFIRTTKNSAQCSQFWTVPRD